MSLFKGKRIKKGADKMDKIVTGVIIGSAIASIFGLSRTKKGKEISHDIKLKIEPTYKKVFLGIKKYSKKSFSFVIKLFDIRK